MADSLNYMAAGFIAAWLVIGGYLVYLSRAQRRLTRKLEALEKAHGND